jgi:tetratricopeptide (TPR) repeat protein
MKGKSFLFFCVIVACLASCHNNDENKNIKNVSAQISANDYPSVITNLTKQLNQNPDSMGLRILLATAFDSIGDFKHALIQMDTLLMVDSLNSGLWFTEGQILQDAKDTLHAIESYSRSAKIYPAPGTLLSIANLYAEQKNPKSLEICNHVKDLGLGGEYDAHCDFIAGVYNARTGQRDKALQLFDACIQSDFTYMEAYIEKGLVYFDEKKYRNALDVFQFASTIDKLFPDSYYWMARCYEMMGVKDSAVLRFKQSLSLDKTMNEAHEGLKRLGEE